MITRVPPPPQWQKGQSGNPGGRRNMAKVRAAIREGKPRAIQALFTAIGLGEPWAVTLWFHYYYGKPVDQVQLMDTEGEPLSVSVVINRTVKREETPIASPALIS